MRRAAFFDRDGTINVDVGYLHKNEDLQFIPNTVNLIKMYNEQGWPVVVVSNQSGIARGMFTTEDVNRLHGHMNEKLNLEYGAHIDAFYFCPHLPAITGECECRKPKPGMFLKAAIDLNIDLTNSVSYGDSERDELASRAAKIGKFYYV